ncbi:MAG: hypothetical protein KBD56_01910 [Candidatus Eisenbacteria bacterium]|nr:hypothetical protein [Candidatus Eisenbacteria bacterium]
MKRWSVSPLACGHPRRGFVRPLACAAGLLLAFCGWLTPAGAQEDLWVPDIPLTRDAPVSARALGMGGAYIAVSDDATALRYNPAGLARIQRIEFLGTLSDLRRTSETSFHEQPAENELSRTRISAVGFAYPFPTYRGSAVIALGYMAPWPLDLQYGRSADFDGRSIQEDLFEEGQIGEYSAGGAIDVSPTLSVGARATWIHGERTQDWVYRDLAGGFDTHDIFQGDIDGYTGSLGALARVSDWGRLGVVLDLPRYLNMEGSIVDIYGDSYSVDEDITLPFRVGLGLSATLPNLLLTGDARFTDWSQIDYEGPLRYQETPGDPDSRRLLAYKRTWDVHAGGEYLLDSFGLAGVRVRAGVAWEPVPYRILLEDAFLQEVTPQQGEEPTYTAVPVYWAADFDPDRFLWTAGVGVLIAQSLTVDAAYSSGHFTRTGSDLREKESERRLLVTVGFRLE